MKTTNNKIKLQDLKVKSFTTQLNTADVKTINGGVKWMGTGIGSFCGCQYQTHDNHIKAAPIKRAAFLMDLLVMKKNKNGKPFKKNSNNKIRKPVAAQLPFATMTNGRMGITNLMYDDFIF